MMSLAGRWDELAEMLVRYHDVTQERVTDGRAPGTLAARGWVAPLLSLSEEALIAHEVGGSDTPWPDWFPESLHALRREAREVCAMPELVAPSEPSRPLRRLETPRKRAQVNALAALTPPLCARAKRIVEVASGHGHLAREVAAQVDLPVIALDRDEALWTRARKLANDARLTFQQVDVLRDGLALREGDCALGLHACGELGDALVAAVAESATSLLLVGCCLQKRRGATRPTLNTGRASNSALEIPTSLLGLSNFTPREQGVEASRAANVAAREHRLALHRLLEEELGELRFGAEMDSVNRRAAHRPFASLVDASFRARGLPTPSAARQHDALHFARALHDRIRRLSLPRALLGRVLETFVFIDRALHLENASFHVTIGTAFPKEISARNLTLCAHRQD